MEIGKIRRPSLEGVASKKRFPHLPLPRDTSASQKTKKPEKIVPCSRARYASSGSYCRRKVRPHGNHYFEYERTLSGRTYTAMLAADRTFAEEHFWTQNPSRCSRGLRR